MKTTKRARVKIQTIEDFRRTCRMTREDRRAWEEMKQTLVLELTMLLWAIRRGNVPPAPLVGAVQTLCESAEYGWGDPEEGEAPAVDIDVLDPWYLLHPHPVCSA